MCHTRKIDGVDSHIRFYKYKKLVHNLIKPVWLVSIQEHRDRNLELLLKVSKGNLMKNLVGYLMHDN